MVLCICLSEKLLNELIEGHCTNIIFRIGKNQ